MLFCANTSINKLYAFGLTLLLAATLAGCGGGSGGGADTTDPPVTTPDSALQMAADAAEAASMAAATAAGNTSDHAAAAAEKMKADAAAAAAATAAAAAQTAADAGDLATAQAEQAKAEAAKADAEAAMAAAAMLASDAMAAEMMAGVAAKTKAAGTKAAAIDAEAMGSTTAPFDSATASENYTVTVEHKDGAVAVKLAIPGAAMDDPEFMRADALPATEGWDGSMHALGPNDDGETEIVGVYTDIAAPKPTEFAMVHSLDVSTNTDNDTPQTTNEALSITGGQSGNSGMMASPGFSASGAGTLTFNAKVDDNPGTTDVDESADAYEIMGTFAGAPGAIRCNGSSGSTCTVTLDADGKVTDASTGWIFTPDAGATVDVADADYLYYGFWVKKTEGEDGAITYNAVQTFAGAVGIDEFPRSGMVFVRGTASYQGGAAGVYMKKAFTSDGELDTATSGAFTADVNLMAYFGGDDVAVNKKYSVEGSVSNFALSGGEENAWSVNLKADFGQSDNAFSGTANGGGAEAMWNGTFYGAAENTPATDDDANTNLAPPSVAGEFNAHFSNGHVAGAFGAHRQ